MKLTGIWNDNYPVYSKESDQFFVDQIDLKRYIHSNPDEELYFGEYIEIPELEQHQFEWGDLCDLLNLDELPDELSEAEDEFNNGLLDLIDTYNEKIRKYNDRQYLYGSTDRIAIFPDQIKFRNNIDTNTEWDSLKGKVYEVYGRPATSWDHIPNMSNGYVRLYSYKEYGLLQSFNGYLFLNSRFEIVASWDRFNKDLQIPALEILDSSLEKPIVIPATHHEIIDKLRIYVELHKE